MPYRWSVGLPSMPSPLDLSHVANLRDVGFRFARPSVQWIPATLCTANTKHLRQITIDSSIGIHKVQKLYRREWQGLDHLLVQLWASRSIIPKIKYIKMPEWRGITAAAPILLSKLVKRRVECEVGDYYPQSQ